MSDPYVEKTRLPACTLDAALIARLWTVLAQDGGFVWQAVVGTGGDVLGGRQERPLETVADYGRLLELLAALPRIDSLQFTAEITGKGTISFTFRNYNPPAGILVVAGADEDWAADRSAALLGLFAAARAPGPDLLYNKWVFALVHSVAPLLLGSVIAVLAGALLVPAAVRRSDFVWWVAAGTMVATLWLAAKISNRLIARCLRKYPYIRWQT